MSLDRFPHLAQRLFNTPLAITPGKIEVVMAALADRFVISHLFRANGTQVSMMEDDDGDWGTPAWMLPSEVVQGVMVIRTEGTLVHKLGTLQPYCGMTGYDGIRSNLVSAWENPDVRGIMLHVDSPGGEVSGAFDLADLIHANRGRKPIWAILDESAYSAAYALASACDRITVPRTGGTGSVGVICAHVDFSKALSEAGIAVTLITYGSHKGEGNEYEPLPDAVRERFQADVDRMGDLFVETVARNRGLPTSKVRKTEAGTYMGRLGVEVGFADAVMAPDEAFRSLLAELG
jgi:signal peptide peptidase SppA